MLVVNRDILVGALGGMYLTCGVFELIVILWYDLPYKVSWKLLLLPLLILVWPYYVWRAIASYHGRG